MSDLTEIVAYLSFLILPIAYIVFFRKKLEFFTGVSPKKFLLVYIFISLTVTISLMVLLLDNCGLLPYGNLIEVIQAVISLLAVVFALIFFKDIIFRKE